MTFPPHCDNSFIAYARIPDEYKQRSKTTFRLHEPLVLSEREHLHFLFMCTLKHRVATVTEKLEFCIKSGKFLFYLKSVKRQGFYFYIPTRCLKVNGPHKRHRFQYKNRQIFKRKAVTTQLRTTKKKKSVHCK